MPSVPYARVKISVDGGAFSTSPVTATTGQTIRLRGVNTSGWDTQRFELYGFPSGFATPAGWTLGDDGVIYYETDALPPDFTMPAATEWGKWGVRLVVNGRLPASNANLVDESMVIEMLGPNGEKGIFFGESTQCNPEQQWPGEVMDTLRSISAVLAGGGVSPGAWADNGSGGVNAYADAGEDFTIRANGAAGTTKLDVANAGTITATAGGTAAVVVTSTTITATVPSIVGPTANNRVASQVTAKARATSGGTTTLTSSTLRDDCMTRVDVTVEVIEEGSTNHASWTLRGTYARNSAGAPVESKTGADTQLEAIGSNGGSPPATWDCILDVSSNDWRVRLTLPAVNAQAKCITQVSETTNANTP